MTRAAFALCGIASVLLFPWPYTAALAFAASFVEPLLPFTLGLFSDTVYYTPQSGLLPLFTIGGATLTAVALFVRSRL